MVERMRDTQIAMGRIFGSCCRRLAGAGSGAGHCILGIRSWIIKLLMSTYFHLGHL